MWSHFFCQPGPFTACAPLHTSAHLCAPLHTFMHPCTPLCFTFPGLVTLIQLSSDLRPPSGYPGQPSPSATRHSTHSRPLYNQVQPLQPPCGPSALCMLIAPEPPPPFSVNGSKWHRCVPPTLG